MALWEIYTYSSIHSLTLDTFGSEKVDTKVAEIAFGPSAGLRFFLRCCGEEESRFG